MRPVTRPAALARELRVTLRALRIAKETWRIVLRSPTSYRSELLAAREAVRRLEARLWEIAVIALAERVANDTTRRAA